MRKLFSIILFFASFAAFAQTTVPVPDPKFLAYLKTISPSVINASNQLITSQAATITGTIDCSNLGISSLSGLQYFTGINTLYATGNNLVTVPEIAGLSTLKYIHLTNNSITSLPSLNSLTNLVYLICSNNQLKKLPSLNNNTQLKQLIAFNNDLDSLPSLNTLTNLRKIDVGGNNLKVLPDLSNQPLLEELLCWENQLTTLPDLNLYPYLIRLNAGTNKLTQVPDVSLNKRLRILSLNDNLFTSGPDLIGIDSLTTVELYNNYLSFKDLVPYLSYPSFNSVFKISPQLNFPGATIQLNNLDTLQIPGIDAGTSGVIYQWYFNGQLLSSTSDSLKIIPFTPSNEGTYYGKETHPSFPGLVLTTDNYIVTSSSCLSFSGISFIIDEINCLKAGTLNIQWTSPPLQPLSYSIQSLSGKTYSSPTGSFKGLTESDYILTVKSGSSCQKQYPGTIHIPTEECTETYITPDKDGDKDSFYFTASGKVVIYDKNGAVVKTLLIPSEWDGSSKLGKLVGQGYYVADINDGQELIKISVLY
jgi:hypothetical protein